LNKPISSEQLIDAIDRALAHQRARADATRKARTRFRILLATLTQRERQVFDLIVRGRINKQVAHELGTTERTVKGAPPSGDGEDASWFARGARFDRGATRNAQFEQRIVAHTCTVTAV